MEWTLTPVTYNSTGLFINEHSIVERWERPIQDVMVSSIIKRKVDKVLEIGYGLGYATKKIELLKPSLHMLVEAHPQIAKQAKRKIGENTSIIVAFWQDAIKLFKENSFDCIIFDAYPLDNMPYTGTSESSLNFVKEFILQASNLIAKKGKLSFLDFSCQIHLLDKFKVLVDKFFTNCEVIEVSLKIPKSCTYAKNNIGNVIVLTK